MSARYEKQGATARLESSARATSLVRLREAGWSEVIDGVFSSGPLPFDRTIDAPEMKHLCDVEESVRDAARGRAVVERLTIVAGVSSHSISDAGRKRLWSDASARIFLTLVVPGRGIRTSLALGAPAIAEIGLTPIRAICQALALPPVNVTSPSVLSLEPWISASLVRALADHRIDLSGSLRLVQAPPSASFDGSGRKPRRRIVRRLPESWPESFRPTYRFEPSCEPLHVDIAGSRESHDSTDAIVVATLSNWRRDSARHFSAGVLVTDPERSALSICEIIIDATEWNPARVQTGKERSWFPEGAGAWGRTITLRSPAAVLRTLQPAPRLM